MRRASKKTQIVETTKGLPDPDLHLVGIVLQQAVDQSGYVDGAGQRPIGQDLPVAQDPSPRWYARPVLFVSDLQRSLAFYVDHLGFKERWRYEDAGSLFVAQVDRQTCELILSSQEPEKTGRARVFISLDVDVLHAVRAELEGRGVAVEDGRWGYPLMVVRDPDGNELFFPYPADDANE
jgi:catechol 2,3-dioxygenase-like lactoylglutathione lyase family enzyme